MAEFVTQYDRHTDDDPPAKDHFMARTRLLVSVRDLAEAQMALDAGVDWIDVKEPSAGSLGAPDPDVATDIAALVSERPSSVALGEFNEYLNAPEAERLAVLQRMAELVRLFPYAKFGLSNLPRGWQVDFAQMVQMLAGLEPADASVGTFRKIVPVLYADFDSCRAATPPDVLQMALTINARFVLVDTFQKDGRNLLDFQSSVSLRKFIAEAQKLRLQVVLAGSLRPEHFHALLPLGPFAIGVRGAACERSRSGTICPARLSEVVAQFHDGSLR